MKLATKLGLVTMTVVASLIATGGPALAAEPDLSVLRSALTARIDLRLAALAKDAAVVTAAKHLTSADKSTLTSLIGTDTAAMTALKTKVASETTAAALKDDATNMVDNYRIFLLVGPKVRLAIAGDAEAAALTRLQQAHDKLADLLAKAKAGGTDTTTAEQDLAAMAAAITKATNENSGQVAAVLAIPAGSDGAAIRAKIVPIRQALGGARADMKTAIADARKVTAFLKTLKK